MSARTYARRIPRRLLLCFTAATLAILAWSSPALCDEIHEAAAQGDVKRVEALLKQNPELVTSKDKDGATPLHKAASLGRKDIVALLLANKADVNAKDDKGNTPLHAAALVEVLSSAADLGAALGQAVGEKILPAPEKAAPKPEEKKPDLSHDWAERQTGVVQMLLAKKADVNAGNSAGATPLHYAALLGCKDMAGLLLANKADVNAQDSAGNTPLKWAVSAGKKDLADLLRQHGGRE